MATAVQNRLPRSTALCPRGDPQCTGQAREASPAWAASGGESAPRGAARPQPACAGVQQGPGVPYPVAHTAWISCICLGSKYARMTRRKLRLCRVVQRSRNFTRLRPEIVVDEIAGGAPIPDPLRCRPCRLGVRNRRERDGLGSQPPPDPEEGLGGGCGAVWMNCKDYGICKGLVSKNASNNIMSNLPSISSCRNRNIASINFRMELVFERRALRRICII